MKLNVSKILLKKSDTLNKVPAASALTSGEVTLNYNAERPFLSFKDNTGSGITNFFRDRFIVDLLDSGEEDESILVLSKESAYISEMKIDIMKEYCKNGVILRYKNRLYIPHTIGYSQTESTDDLVFYNVSLEDNDIVAIRTIRCIPTHGDFQTLSFVYGENKTSGFMVVDLTQDSTGEITFADSAMTFSQVLNAAKENGNVVARLFNQRLGGTPLVFQLALYSQLNPRTVNFINFTPTTGATDVQYISITQSGITIRKLVIGSGNSIRLDNYSSLIQAEESGLTDPIDASMTINEAIATLAKVITDNELTISSAFNDLNARITDLEEQIANL